jgi:hypothetical protein
MLNSEQEDEGCDATEDDSSTEAGNINNILANFYRVC